MGAVKYMKRCGGQETQYFGTAMQRNVQDSLDLNSDVKSDLLLNWQSGSVFCSSYGRM